MTSFVKNIILTAAGVSIIVFVSAGFLLKKKETHIAYVDNMKLFNEFVLKKELENDLKKKEIVWKAQLDSMRIQINLLGKRIEAEKLSKEAIEQFEFTRQQYLAKEQQFTEDNEKTAKQFNEQIWKQLNNYVKVFAKENEYDLVLGTSGEGNLMYAHEQLDVTDAAIAFVNQKYKGKM